jgi:UDP-N-acetylglucosamine 2-epimerase (non-hydrolysing)
VAIDSDETPRETIQHILVHTGQHYDEVMSSAFFRDLGLPKPDVHLGVGSASHAVQTAEIMKKFEPVVVAEKPDAVVVVGDVNSTLACALVAAKISFDTAGARPLIAHVEAGLRSFDRAMPEEVNRVLTDELSDLLFVTEESGVRNLRNEGIAPDKIHFVGNTMIDSLLAFKDKAEASTILGNLGLRAHAGSEGGTTIRPYALLTLHRPSNVDDPAAFSSILDGLEDLAQTHPIIFPVHPRTRQRLEQSGMPFQEAAEAASGVHHGIIFTEPLGYLDFLCLMKHAELVVTDSGGIQEETTCLGIPCVTVRNNTERPVTVEKGTNIIAGTDRKRIKDAVRRQITRKPAPPHLPEMWDGQAATRIVATLLRVHASDEKSLTGQPLFA